MNLRDQSRRRLLQAMGLGALFLPSLSRSFAKRDPSQPSDNEHRQPLPPLSRLLVLFATQGTYRPRWRINPENLADDQAWNFDVQALAAEAFSPCLAPLHRVRQHLLLLDGVSLAMTSQYRQNEHNTGHAIALSGAKPRFEGNYVTQVAGPSLDQVIAASFSPAAPLASLHYGRPFAAVSHDHRGQPIPHETDARAAFARLFPGQTLGADHSDGDGLMRGRLSVLDRVAQQTKALERKLSGEDRQKLAQHHAMIRDLERQLQAVQAIKCTVPPPPAAEPSEPQAWIDWNANTWSQLAITALACGLSRVALIYDSGPDCTYLGLPDGDIHRDHAHFVDLMPTAKDAMTEFYRYYAKRLATIIEALAAIPDGNGTMLDSTLVLMANDVGSPSHDWAHYPMVLAGGKNHFKNGRYLYWPASQAIAGPSGPVAIGPAHHRVLVSIAQGFGLATDTIGEQTLPGADGQSVDLRGGLPELLRA